MKDLILFGVQGCGKGTQGQILAREKGYRIFETGKELRALIANEGSRLGQKIKGIVEEGNLVPDEVVIEIVDDFLKKTGSDQAVVFDGIPRKVSQKALFEKVMKKNGREPLAVLIHISDELALIRLDNRWMSKSTEKIFAGKEAALAECPENDVYQRADYTPKAIKTRLKNYHKETQPVIDWYEDQDRLVKVSGEQEVEGVTKELMERVV